LAKGLLQSLTRPLRNAAIGRRLRETGLLPPTGRSAFLGNLSGSGARVLEIGPFDAPQVRGDCVSYFDVLDTEQLRARAQTLGRRAEDVPPIRFVSPTGDLRVVTDRFDAVLSCHAVEHQPDLIRHLQGVGGILRPGGRYLLIIPDKRFTFDYYLAESQLQDVLTAYSERRTVHSRESVLAHHLQTTHNSCVRHWLGQHGRATSLQDGDLLAREAADRAARGEYVDVHAWIFSPSCFKTIMSSLIGSGHIPFSRVDVHETEVLAPEFFAVLTRPLT
jgi:SAM-dependent methyltransferase